MTAQDFLCKADPVVFPSHRAQAAQSENPQSHSGFIAARFSVIVIYYQNYVAFLDPLEYQEMVLTLSETARKKTLAKTRKLRRGFTHLCSER
ncbi:MAG: hypothetical protein DMG15_28975 [Acidobacteria bacterium]|nr:MAG: hypothetical protein DMG15_28975 [Acidobacteriota bacterium]